MFNNRPKTIVNINRTFKVSDFALRFYAIYALLIVVIFGFFGIRPLYTLIKEKKLLLEELAQVNKNLENNILFVKEINNNLSGYESAVAALDKYMPSNFDSHNFLLDFISVVSAQGFFVSRFTPEIYNQPDPSMLNIRVDLSGTGNVEELITSIESMRRITQVKDVKYTFEDSVARNQKKVSLSVEIYSTNSL